MNRFLFDTGITFRLARHLLFFMLTVVAFTAILYAQNTSHSLAKTFLITLGNAVFFFGYAYITIFLLIPELLLKGKLLWFILVFVLIGVGLSALKLVFSNHIFYSSIAPENVERYGILSLRYMVVNTKDMTFIVALFCIGKYVKDYLYTENNRRKLEEQHQKAQSKLLQSQFDPHFMFNTINNLYALSLLNPQKTNEVVSRMKTVLNYIIDESLKDRVTLEDEVILVENFLQLEKLRYGKRLKIEYKTEGDLLSHKIPPMLLFLLVENSFKHGSSLDAGNPWIKIFVKVDSGTVVLETQNSKPETTQKSRKEIEKGKGISGLKKRLNIVYQPNGYKLDIDDYGDWFKVRLELNSHFENWQITYR